MLLRVPVGSFSFFSIFWLVYSTCLGAFCGNARKQTYSLVFFPYFVHLSLKMIEAPPKKDCCGEVINRRRLPHLTQEEKAKVEALKITGLSNPEIARSMGMSCHQSKEFWSNLRNEEEDTPLKKEQQSLGRSLLQFGIESLLWLRRTEG